MHDLVQEGTPTPGERVSGPLRQAVRSWDSILELLPIAVYICDSKGLIIQYNQRAAQLWGRAPEPGESEERFCGSHQLYLVDGRAISHAESPMAEVLRTGAPARNREVVIGRPDGARKIALVNIDPLFDANGNVSGAVNCFQDVTELRRVHADLGARQEELEDFFENAAVALHLVAADGTILRANRAELALLGYERDEYVGRSIVEFHADKDAIDQILASLHRGQRLDRVPARLKAKDGSIRDVLITSNAQFRDGKFVNSRCFTIDVTEWKRAEAALQERDRRLEATYEHATVAIAEVDAEGRRLRVNGTACEITGYSRDELTGQVLFANDDPAYPHNDREQFQRLVAGEIDRYSVEKPIVRKDGKVIWISATCSAVRDNDARFLYAVRVFDDITQSKLLADALTESEQRLAATYEQATIGISESDADGRLLRVNEASCKITGYSREELLRRGPFFQQMRSEEAEKEREIYQRQVRGEIDRYAIEKRIRRKDGREIWTAVMSSSVRDAQGNFRYAVRVIQDISQRKLAEERLRASERRLRELLEGLPAAVYMTDREGRITYFNRAAVEFSGRTPTLGSDRWCVSLRLCWPDGTPMPHEECPMAIALREQREVRGMEAIAERPDGTRVPFLPYPTPLFDEDGNLVGAVNMLIDITERKKAELQQSTLIDELNHRVKNTLATVQSLARQTARGAVSLTEFEEMLQGRLIALSHAHDQLTHRNWQTADLREILGAALLPYEGEIAEQVAIRGEPVMLRPRSALTLAMVFHELTTNAVKYGALSQPAGRLEIAWDIESGEEGSSVRFRWQESGGPTVDEPRHRGFGTRMVERSVPAELGGSADLRFEPAGVVCELQFPLADDGEQNFAEPGGSTRICR